MTSSSLSRPPSPPRRVCVYCVGALHCLLVFLCCLHVGASYYLLGLCSIVYWGFVYLTTPPSDPSHPLTRSSPFPPFNMYEVMWVDCRELSNPEETYHQVQHCGENIDILEAMVNCPDFESMMKVVNQCTHKYIKYIYILYIYIHIYIYS